MEVFNNCPEIEKCPRCDTPVRIQLCMGAKYCWHCGCRLDKVELKGVSEEDKDEFLQKCLKLLKKHSWKG